MGYLKMVFLAWAGPEAENDIEMLSVGVRYLSILNFWEKSARDQSSSEIA